MNNDMNSGVSPTDEFNTNKTLPFQTHIEYAQSIKFNKPAAPVYATTQSILSIVSLLFMTALSVIMLNNLLNPTAPLLAGSLPSFLTPPVINSSAAAWVWLPFAFTVFGASVGAAFEIYLLLKGTPFQQDQNRATRFIKSIRLLNLAPVTLSIFFFYSCVLIADPALRIALLYFSGAVGCGLAFALFFGGAQLMVFMTLVGSQLLQVLLVLTTPLPIGGMLVAALLIIQSSLQLTALLIGAETPLKSTAFHIISTFSGIMLYLAFVTMSRYNPAYSIDVSVLLTPSGLLFWGFVASCLVGVILTAKQFPMTYNNFRSVYGDAIWSRIYFVLVSAKRFPKPFNLSKVYNNIAPKQTILKPYYLQHPEYLPQSLAIPAAENLEGNVTIFKQLVTKVRKIFALIALFDHFIPQVNINTPLKEKPRIEPWSDGSEYWPRLFSKTIFGQNLPEKYVQKAPEQAIAAYKAGQLLSYLTESGVANPFLQAAPADHPADLMIDFRHLEKYETKPDYENYGGAAYFKINQSLKKLELISVVAPRTNLEIHANPINQVFRRAESLVIASMYYQVISGKHLAEIHMTYNLVEVAMHNAFDAQGQWAHPFRTFLYLHFFSHELAEEMTTEHLVQDGAVFSQIFATTHNALVNHLNHSYENFHYGQDEEFEKRASLLTFKNENGKEEILPNACIKWELEYVKIWKKYATSLIEAIYQDDKQVQNDQYIQDFHQGLLEFLVNGLPARYADFKTRDGLIRFVVDTMHHMVIRHQVYGTTGVRAVMDPRLSSVQVPRDMGTAGVDEWRCLAYVALATARARFTLLINDFTYLLEGVDSQYQSQMRDAFNTLQDDLKVLEAHWNTSQEDKQFNYEYFRAVPSELHSGPGY